MPNFEAFLQKHPELQDSSADEQLEAYQMYCDTYFGAVLAAND